MSVKETNARLVQDNLDLKCEAEGKDARIAGLEAENERLKDGLVRIIQCNNYPLTITAVDLETGESGPHCVDGYNCSDVLAVIHDVFPDFSAWDEERARKQLEPSRWAERSAP